MLKSFLHIIFLSVIPFILCAQNQKIKKEIVIRNTIDHYGNSIIDTSFISYYDTNGIFAYTTYPNRDGTFRKNNVIEEVKRTTIDSTKNKIHFGILRSDSSYWDNYKTFYKDSIVTITIENKDTIMKRIDFRKGEKTIKIVIKCKSDNVTKFDNNFYYAYQEFNYKRNNYLYSKALVVRNEDTTIETLNKVFHISKTYSYDKDKCKWCLLGKEIKNRNNQVVKFVAIGYDGKTIFKFYYKSGKIILVKQYAPYGNQTKIYNHIYEYY